ncbi:MAG TPA: sigma-70 family RNA polymerase sigma factor [Candidatus Dormibacteraeota bacterium]
MEDFERLVRRHQDAIFAFALSLVGERQEAEDVAQEAFIRAWRAYGGYDEDRRRELKERPWLHRIALNVFRNRLRAKKPALELLEGAATARRSDEPEEVVLRNAWRDDLRRHLLALPRPYREAVVLRHVQGLGYAEAAEVLDAPVGTVKSNVHRGIQRLQERMGGLGLTEVS